MVETNFIQNTRLCTDEVEAKFLICKRWWDIDNWYPIHMRDETLLHNQLITTIFFIYEIVLGKTMELMLGKTYQKIICKIVLIFLAKYMWRGEISVGFVMPSLREWCGLIIGSLALRYIIWAYEGSRNELQFASTVYSFKLKSLLEGAWSITYCNSLATWASLCLVIN